MTNKELLDKLIKDAGSKKLPCGCRVDKAGTKIIDCGQHGGGRFT